MGVGILPAYIIGSGGGSSGPVTGTLAGLSDVTISAPISAQVLTYGNDGKWHNTNLVSNPAIQNIQSQITSEVTNRQLGDQNLQQQINQLASGSHIVFCETVTGNGAATQFQLTGAISNGEFISGGWQSPHVLNTLNSDVTDLNNGTIYDAGILSIFTRHKIAVSNINVSGLVTTDYIPQNNQVFKIWYWYDLQGSDRIDNYYRDDYVTKMESTAGDIASNIQANIVNFTNILNSTDTNVQLALETLDKHTHPEIASISAAILSLESTKQDKITLIGGSGVTIVESPASTWTINVTGGPGTSTSVQFPWNYDHHTSESDPSDGDFRLNDTTVANATELYISRKTDNGVNVYNIIKSLNSGDRLYIQNSSSSSQALLVTISASVVDHSNWFTIPISVDGSGTSPTFSEHEFLFVIVKGNVSIPSYIAGNGITFTPVGSDTSISVSDYISRTEVASITGGLFYEYHQVIPSLLWNINHPLNKHPSVTTVASAGNVIIGSVTYINNNNLTVRYAIPQIGYAYLN
jgi:hypothetical protein